MLSSALNQNLGRFCAFMYYDDWYKCSIIGV